MVNKRNISSLSRAAVVESLLRLGRRLRQHPVPSEVIRTAVRANPWFTPYYIERALQGLLTWLTPEALHGFLSRYPERQGPSRHVGIIAAGNLPLVAWHDIMMTVLSGHRAWVKPSRQDQVLVAWLFDAWQQEYSILDDFLHLQNELAAANLDYLIATGSNNSAKYFQYYFPQLPKLIRHHRYSVAVLSPEVTDEELLRLNEDLLLYNGLGCRNVSNLLLLPGFDRNRLRQSLEEYPVERLNPLYLERVLYINHLNRVLGKSLIHTPVLSLEAATSPGSSAMGVARVVDIVAPEVFDHWLEQYRKEWQCVVGQEVRFGQTQSPGLDDFADGIDSMAILLDL